MTEQPKQATRSETVLASASIAPIPAESADDGNIDSDDDAEVAEIPHSAPPLNSDSVQIPVLDDASQTPSNTTSDPQPPAGTSTSGGFDLVGHTLLDRYFVLSQLGQGGMGTVYLAEHTTIKRRFALKVLSHEYSRKSDLVERFLQEARAASMISQENVVEISDFGDTPDGSVFFVMEFLDGEDLGMTVKLEGRLPWDRVRVIMLQVCRALQAAHDVGIIHRDMKPENCFRITRSGNSDFIKVLDFGIAKLSGQDGESDKGLTRTGMIFGTPEYMSPEQAQGTKPDLRVDIYALGVIMYELLTGQVPFTADTFMGILTKHMFEAPRAPSDICAEATIPPEVEAIVLKAMQKDRNFRFQSMTEMAEAIAAVGSGAQAVSVVSEQLGAPSMSGEMSFGGRAAKTALGGGSNESSRSMVFPAMVVAALLGGGYAASRLFSNNPGEGTAAAVVLPAPPVEVQKRPEPKIQAPPEPQPAIVPQEQAPPEVTIWISTPLEAQIIDPTDDSILGSTNSESGLQTDKSSEPLRLTLRAPGHEDLLVDVVPNRDKRFERTLKKQKRRGRNRRNRASAVSGLPKIGPGAAAKKDGGSNLHAPDLKDPFKR